MIASTAPAGAGKDGLGAVLKNGGCTFRVWAPFASAVEVGGDFFNAGNLEPSAWDEVPLARDAPDSPYWSVFIQQATRGLRGGNRAKAAAPMGAACDPMIPRLASCTRSH